VCNLDDVYVMCIRQANLDAMGGRAVLTIQSHASALKRVIQNCCMIRKTPTIPLRGPMPCADDLVMGMAVDMLFNLLMAKPCLKGEKHIQFDLMRRPKATFTSAWESSPGEIREGATFCDGGNEGDRHIMPYSTEVVWFVSKRSGK
jgi:hypothetical protein